MVAKRTTEHKIFYYSMSIGMGLFGAYDVAGGTMFVGIVELALSYYWYWRA